MDVLTDWFRDRIAMDAMPRFRRPLIVLCSRKDFLVLLNYKGEQDDETSPWCLVLPLSYLCMPAKKAGRAASPVDHNHCIPRTGIASEVAKKWWVGPMILSSADGTRSVMSPRALPWPINCSLNGLVKHS